MALQTLFRLLAPVLFFAMLSGCAVSNKFGPYIGKVVDAETKEPIEGAVVFMECSTATASPGGENSHYAGFKEVLTNENGEFSIELRLSVVRPGHLWEYSPFITVFKPAYGVFPWHRDANADILVRNTSHILPENTYVTITLPKLKTIKERKKNLRSVNIIYISKIPFEKRQNIFRLENIESVQLGLKPIPKPK